MFRTIVVGVRSGAFQGRAAVVASVRYNASRAAAADAASRTKLGFSKFQEVAAYGKGKVRQDMTRSPEECGEDSFFVTQELMSTVGVADGVGGWRTEGVDPGRIARGIMSNCMLLSEERYSMPYFLLAEAYYKVKYGKEVDAGSTTACVAALREAPSSNGEAPKLCVFTSNLGDSGYVLVRNGEIVHSSNPQRSGYNAPAQLAIIPESRKAHGFIDTQPHEADNDAFEVQKGDYLVLATDGLWDNVKMDRIQEIGSQAHNADEFSQNLVVAGITRPVKPDDVTVVVARV
eukprot:TRINITY_DN42875_c0_g1_i1.p1 TRINITY_DN42875_c0_g1~~TRINITY_DN42875_c0_g1_i1.p1  ORF type:complete len:289 (+),score=116.71 TRINITY_DN42875_c0_g1_i1:84-950(+)